MRARKAFWLIIILGVLVIVITSCGGQPKPTGVLRYNTGLAYGGLENLNHAFFG